MSHYGAARIGGLAALIVFLADQGSKYWILHVLGLRELGQVVVLPFLNLTMVWNQGITFGLMNGLGPWGHYALAALAILVILGLLIWLRRAETVWASAAIGVIAGGAVGNVLDRLRYGAVVDFLHFHLGQWSWYVFNVSDAAIVCGVAALLLENQFGRRPKQSGRPLKYRV